MTYMGMHPLDLKVTFNAIDRLSPDQLKDLYDVEPPSTGYVLAFSCPQGTPMDVLTIEGEPHHLAALIRRIVTEGTRALAGSPLQLLPDLPRRVQILAAAVAGAVHGAGLDLTPEAALVLADQIDDVLHRHQLSIVDQHDQQTDDQQNGQHRGQNHGQSSWSTPGQPPHNLGFTASLTAETTTVGTSIWRYTTATPDGHQLSTTLPCCDRPYTLTAPVDPDDPLTRDTPASQVCCPFCALLFEVSAVEASDSRAYDDTPTYEARFTIVGRPGIVARRARIPRTSGRLPNANTGAAAGSGAAGRRP